ncbi:Sec63-domain-containing protein [Coprinopsis marcescibilis]|uniref:Sec63-domain-containing protein n=1 Tax=Coprinopsis marcescibilis TaxID=230819 RepID=A0A5C3KHF4_COPMA|nr:Sec63-domain-containing protein [Coprinopsis marcescibilis]
MSSNAWLNALCAVDVSQMCVQGMWETDSPLKQIPHFESEAIKRCKDAGVNSVYDIMELEDDTRNKLLQMNPAQMCVPFRIQSSPSSDEYVAVGVTWPHASSRSYFGRESPTGQGRLHRWCSNLPPSCAFSGRRRRGRRRAFRSRRHRPLLPTQENGQLVARCWGP